MEPKRTSKPSTGKDRFETLEAFPEPEQLLAALSASTVGLAICDRQFRFRAANSALASMNGIPAEALLGKTVRSILGEAAVSMESAIERVLTTGQTVSNSEISAKLPARIKSGHWIENYFPIKDAAGRVMQVGAIIVEVTGQKEREEALRGAMGKSLQRLILAMHELEVLMRQVLQDDAWTYPLDACADHTLSSSKEARGPHKSVSSENSARGASGNAPPITTSTAASHPQARIVSPREREVIRLLAGGKTNKSVSSILGISVKTVETHRSKIMLKLNLDSLAGLVRYAILNRIVDL
jgi:PAS domain S-box-containing protein